MGTYSANLFLQQGVLALPWPCDVALREDALTLLRRSLPDCCTPLASSTRSTAACWTSCSTATKGRGRRDASRCWQCPATTSTSAAERRRGCSRRVPTCSLERHVPPVRGRPPPYRRRSEVRRSDRLGQLAAGQWLSHAAARRLSAGVAEATAARQCHVARPRYPIRWPEKVDRKSHPHMKPADLIARLIGAVTGPVTSSSIRPPVASP